MANPKVGQITSYDVVENVIDFSDILNEKKMPSTPLLNKIGILNEPVYSTTYQWYDEAFPILNTAVEEESSAPASGNRVLKVDSTAGILVNSILKVGDALYRVTKVTNPTVLEVMLVVGDEDSDTITAGTAVTIVSNSSFEGADYEDGHYNPLIERENYTQIFKDYVKITGTQDAVRRKVRGAILAQEIDNKMKRLRVMLERAAWLGIRTHPGNNNAPRLMGGIDWFITNNSTGIIATSDLSGTTPKPNFEANFKAFLGQIYDVRGSVNEAWMNPVTMEYFLALGKDALVVDQYSEQAGRNVKMYVSQYGETALNMSPDIPPNVIYIVDTSNIKIRPLVNRQFQFEELAKTGDSVKGQLIGEYTLEFRNPDLAGKFVIPSV